MAGSLWVYTLCVTVGRGLWAGVQGTLLLANLACMLQELSSAQHQPLLEADSPTIGRTHQVEVSSTCMRTGLGLLMGAGT